MPVAFGIYTIVLTFVATVPLAFLAYGVIDYRRHPDELTGLFEAGAGVILGTYLLVFHYEAVTDTLLRAFTQGGIAARFYVLLPVVAGVVITDYLLKRVIPLLQAGVERLTAKSDTFATGETGTVRTRRSVLGVSLGVLTAGFAGGFSMVDGFLGSGGSEGNNTLGLTEHASYEAPYFPTALSFSDDGYGFVTSLDGTIYRFQPPSAEDDSIQYTSVATDVEYPQGIEVVGDTLYTVDNGPTASAKYGVEEGYEQLQQSNGEVIAYDITTDGTLQNRRPILSNLPVINSDHALHQIATGPDGRLHLSIGHIGGKKYPEMFDGKEYVPTDEDHPNHEYLGTVIAFDQDGSNVDIVATGLRNVYDLTFDEAGNLYGANNDGMSMRSKVWEALLHIDDGDDFGYPEYGTFDSSPGDVTDPLAVFDTAQSTGVETTDKIGAGPGVVVGLLDKIAYVPIERGDDSVYVPRFYDSPPTVIEPGGPPIVVEAGPDDRLWVGSIGRDDLFTLYEPTA